MSNKAEQDLAAFYEEFVEGPGIDKLIGAQERALLQAAQGGTGARLKYAAEDLAQNHGGQVVAGVLAAAALANSDPTIAANAESVGLSGGTAPHAQVAHYSKTRGSRPEIVIVTMEPGDTIDKYGEKYADRMGVTVPTADAEIGAESSILPGQDNDIQVGTKLKILLDHDIAVVPAGEGMGQVAEEHGVSLARLEALNPQPNYNLLYVNQHLRLRSEPAVEPKPEAPKAQLRVEQHVSVRPAPQKIAPKPTVEPKIAAVAPVVKSKPVVAPVPKKAHATLAPKPSTPFDLGLQQDISRAFKAAASSVNKSSNSLQLNVINGFTDVIRRTDNAIKEPGHSKHHSKSREGAVKPGDCTSTGHMPGKTPRQVVMNFDVICEGLSVPQAAGEVGNMEQENGNLDPEAIQGGGRTDNPAALHKEDDAWGLYQWTPGSKALSESKKYGVKRIKTLQGQLVLGWAEMKGQSPTGQLNMVQGMKRLKDPNQAAEYFEQNFEEGPIAASGGGQLANRQKYAREAARELGPSALAAMHSLAHWQGGGSHAHHAKPHHAKPRHTGGDVAIYHAALKYNPDSYSETMPAGHDGVAQYHITFPKVGPKSLIDCSGLVDEAVSDATGGRDQPNENTRTERQDHKRWKHIRYIYAGHNDLIQPVINGHVGNHVEIINRVKGNEIYTFGAHTSQAPQPEQVGPAKYIYNRRDIFLRYIGWGAHAGNGASHHAGRHK